MPLTLTRLLHCLHRLADAPNSASDGLLLDRFASYRDEAAFPALLARHGPMVYRTCRRALGDAGAAEDAFQATFLILARKASSLRRPAAVAGWLHGVALRVAVKARRLRLRLRARQESAQAAEPADPRPEPLDVLTARELLAALDEEVQRLPEEYRLPVLLCCIEGHSQEEAAQRLGCTPGSVKGRLERGRKRLHQRLTKRGLTLPAVLAAAAVSRASLRAGFAAATARAVLALAPGESGTPYGRSAEVKGLVGAALPKAGVGKLKVLVVLAVALGVAALGASVLAPSPPRQPAVTTNETPQEAGQPKSAGGWPVRTDRHGDPLPPDALKRLGTMRHRFPTWMLFRQPLPDGKSVLVTNALHTEIRWVDSTTGRRLDSWPLPSDAKVCGLSSDGRRALLFDGKTLQLWSVTGRKKLQTFQSKDPLGPEIASVCFAPDGKVVATACGVNLNAGLVRVWDVSTGQELWHEGVRGFYDRGLDPLGFLPDEKTVVVLDRSTNRVSLRERATGREFRSFATMPRTDSRSWRLSPDGRTFLFGTAGKAVRAWEVATGKELPPLGGHKEQAHMFAISPDSKLVLTGGADSFLLVWELPAGKRRGTIDLGQARGVNTMAISADGKRAKVILWGETALRFFDLQSGKELPSIQEAHRAPVNGVAVTPEGLVVSAANDDTVRIWDLRSGRQVREIQTGHRLGVTSLAVSADGQLIATADLNSGKILVHQRDTGKLLKILDTERGGAAGLAFAPTGHVLAAGAFNKEPGSRGQSKPRYLGLWNADTGQLVRRLENAGRSAFSPDGQLLAATITGQIGLWEIPSGRERRGGLPAHDFFGFAFSRDGRVLVSLDRHAVTFWELAAGQERCRIEAPGKWVTATRFGPTGRWLVVADGSEVLLVEMLHGRVVHTFRGHDHWVSDLAFTPDSGGLISASSDATLLVWDVAAVAARQPRPAAAPNRKAVEAAWEDLASTDAKAAYQAIGLLADTPGQAVALLRARLYPAPAVDAKRIDNLVTLLDSARFAERDQAVRELEKLVDRAENALRRAIAGGASLEAKRRAERLLAQLEGPVTDRELLRALRAVEVLEWAALPEAQHVLERLAGGAPEARLTREAHAALGRLARRPAAVP